VADILIEGSDLVLELSRMEELEAIHASLRVPLGAVRAVEVVDQPLKALHGGLKLIGTGIPGGTAVGTWLSPDGKTFAVEHHASRGVVVQLEGQTYERLVVGCHDPEEVAERIRSAVRAQERPDP